MNSRSPMRDRSGAVYVEFLVVIVPLLLFFLGLVQLALVYSAHLLVSHAAARAGRAAIVILPDDTGDYAGVPENTIGTGDQGLDAYRNAPEGGRLDQVRAAARIILTPISPSIESYVSGSLADALGDHRGATSVAGVLGLDPYVSQATAVTFPDNGGGYLTDFPASGMITARVTYLYRCQVPLISGIICQGWSGIDRRAREELSTVGAGGLVKAATELAGWRFTTLVSERTLPNQGR